MFGGSSKESNQYNSHELVELYTGHLGKMVSYTIIVAVYLIFSLWLREASEGWMSAEQDKIQAAANTPRFRPRSLSAPDLKAPHAPLRPIRD